ncbi:MAG TPA: hypothetical protein VG099_18700, partial [Gemmataceae bacterium]|nr:hypothetical protein [Gemmataceae bacterium]
MLSVMDYAEETKSCDSPFVRIWGHGDNPLPLRTVRPAARGRTPALGADAPPWLQTGPVGQPF